MTTLPKGWVETELGHVASKIGSGATPKGGNEAYKQSGVPLIRSMNVHFSGFKKDGLAFIDHDQASRLDGVTVESDDVLLNITGASIGRVTCAPPEMAGARVNQHVSIIRLADEVEPKFVQRFLASPAMQEFINSENYGVTRQALTKGMIEAFKLPLPPLAEQKRIVAKVESLTAKSARARAELARVDKLIAKYKQSFVTRSFQDAASHSTYKKIDEIADRVTKGESPKWQGFEYTTSGALFVRSQNVGWGKLLLEDRAYLPWSFNQGREKSVIRTGDVLLNIVGASIGRTAVANEAINGANCNQAVAVIKLGGRQLDAEYLCRWLQSAEAQSRIHDGSVDVARANFSLQNIRDLEVPWPDEKTKSEIVRSIEAAFTKIDRLATEAKRALELTDRLDEKILAKAFRGELVPQDPNDEPASVLLGRIRAERAAAPKGRRGRAAI